MILTYEKASAADIESVYGLCKKLINAYEDNSLIDYEKVLRWVKNKLNDSIDEYTVVYADGTKAGYYHFFKNDDGIDELDDLYIFTEFQNKGIGTQVINKCIASSGSELMLYVFIKNEAAVSLYERLGFKIEKCVGSTRYIMKYKK